MRIYLPQTAISPLTLIRRERFLPTPGEILVQGGDRVDPVHVIGRAHVSGEFRLVNVAQELGIPARALKRHLKVKSGQEVTRGQVLARGGLGHTCRSPIDGQLARSYGGRLLIQAAPHEVEVRAGYYGTVMRILSNVGVVIQVSGALIQGAWGNGHEGFGVLRMVVETRDEALKTQAIDASSRGFILVGGSHIDEEALERAVELQVRGIIVGGVPPELLEKARQAPFPVMATEGIGIIPTSPRFFQLLATHNGREAVVDGQFQSRWEIRRPEVIIPLPAEPGTDRLKYQDTPLQVGNRVRAVRAPHTGVTGTVQSLPTRTVRTTTGEYLLAAKVQPEGAEDSLLIPVANLEALR
jgi:hypothetical protein